MLRHLSAVGIFGRLEFHLQRIEGNFVWLTENIGTQNHVIPYESANLSA